MALIFKKMIILTLHMASITKISGQSRARHNSEQPNKQLFLDSPGNSWLKVNLSLWLSAGTAGPALTRAGQGKGMAENYPQANPKQPDHAQAVFARAIHLE